MKKGQIAGQVFVYILAALIFGAVFLFGYRAIDAFLEKQEEVVITEMNSNLRNSIQRIAPSSDIEVSRIRIPEQFKRVCFIDLRINLATDSTARASTPVCNRNHEDYYPLACLSWQDNISQNVFFDPMTEIALDVGPIELQDGSMCVGVQQGAISLKLQGKGDRTRITVAD